MPNPSLAVLRTIPQRLISGWVPVLVTLGYLVMSFNPALFECSRGPRFNYSLLSGTAFGVGLLAFHLKQIVLDARGRLLPGSPRIPLTVASAIIGLYLLGFPLLIHIVRPAPLVSQMAAIWLVAASVVYWVVRQSWFSGILIILAFISSPAGGLALQMRIADVVETPLIAWSLLAFSGAWLILAGKQLLQMMEETPGYQATGRRVANWNESPASTSEATQAWRDPAKAKWLAFSAPADWRLQHATQPGASATIWTRCRRWRAINQRPYAMWAMICLIGSIMLFTMRILPSSQSRPLAGLFGPVLMMLAMIPLITVVPYTQQWSYRVTDLLKPQRREDFLREMGLCLAIDLICNYVVIASLLAILAIVLVPGPLPQFSSRDVFQASLLILSGVLFSYGVIVWFLRYRLMVVVGLCGPMVVMPLSIVIVPMAFSTFAVLVVASATSVVALALTRSAYRRWLLTDLA